MENDENENSNPEEQQQEEHNNKTDQNNLDDPLTNEQDQLTQINQKNTEQTKILPNNDIINTKQTSNKTTSHHPLSQIKPKRKPSNNNPQHVNNYSDLSIEELQKKIIENK